MDVCVVVVVRRVAWNVKWHEGRKDLNSIKLDQRGKNPGQAKKKSPTGGMDVCLLWVLFFVVRYRSLRRADPSSRGVLPTLGCLSVWSKEITTSTLKRETGVGRRGRLKKCLSWRKIH
jgi:hypothetical protein